MSSGNPPGKETAVVSVPDAVSEEGFFPTAGEGESPGVVQVRTELLLDPQELARMELAAIAGMYVKAQAQAEGDPDSLFAPVARQLRSEAFRRLKDTSNELVTDSVWEMLEVPGLPNSFYSLGVDFLAANGCASYLLDSLFLGHIPKVVLDYAEAKFHALAAKLVKDGWLSSLTDLLLDARKEDHYREKCARVCPHIITLLQSCAQQGEEIILNEVAFRMPHLPGSVSDEAVRLLGDKAALSPSEVPIIVQITVSGAEDDVDIFVEEPLNGDSQAAGNNAKPVPFDPKNKPTREVRFMDNPFRKGSPGGLGPKRRKPRSSEAGTPEGTRLYVSRPNGKGTNR